ncbi:MAG: phosphatase PAP2 family protein [Nitrospirae bacterium]|nr:phosphatase PAP2 family protein [Nitrospirota bacterium]
MIRIIPAIFVILLFIDNIALESIEFVRSPYLKNIMSWLSYLGQGWVQVVVCFILIAIGLIIKKDEKIVNAGKRGIYAVAASGLLSQIIKHIIGRPRPKVLEALGFTLGPSILPGFDSFPSGHATSAFAFAYTLSTFIPWMRYPLYGYALLVCISRIYVGAHFPSDVFAGILLGIWIGRMVATRGLDDMKEVVKKYGPPVGIAAFSFFIMFYNIGSPGLFDVDEAVYAEASREMIVTGNWITPQYNYSNRYDKPVLFYWLMASAFSVFGITEFAARFWSAAFGVLLTLMCYYILRWLGHPKWGVITAVIFATSIEVIVLAHASITDMTLAFFITSALFCFFLGYIRGSAEKIPWWYMGFYLSISLAVLTKGPVGVVLPGAIIFIFLILRGDFISTLKKMHLVSGVLIFLVVALPWYIVEIQINGWEYIDAFFIKHNVTRFTGVVSGHRGSVYYFIPVILFAFFPWSAFLPQVLYKYFPRSRKRGVIEASDSVMLFSIIWFLVIFIFFSISRTKLPGYIAPLSAPLAIMVGRFWYGYIYPVCHPELVSGSLGEGILKQVQNDRDGVFSGARYLKYSFAFMIILSLFIAAGAGFLPNYLADSKVVLKQFQEPVEWGYGLYYIAGVVASAAVLFLLALWRNRKGLAFGIMAGMVTVVSCILFSFVTPVADKYLQSTLRDFSRIASAQMGAEDKLVVYGLNKPSILFYAQRPATILLAKEGDKLNDLIEAPERAFIISKTSGIGSHAGHPNLYVMYEQRGYTLATNKPLKK